MNKADMEQRLWEYIDGFSMAEENAVVETLIRENQQWRQLYQDLLLVHQSLAGIDLEQPALRFTKNVMDEIAKNAIAPATRNYINPKIIWGITAFFILSILCFFIYGLGQINWLASSAPAHPLGIDLNKINYGKMFNSTVMNVFVMVFAVLGLMLLDQFIHNKQKKYHTTA